jgi:hypothetical protein
MGVWMGEESVAPDAGFTRRPPGQAGLDSFCGFLRLFRAPNHSAPRLHSFLPRAGSSLTLDRYNAAGIHRDPTATQRRKV